MVISAGFNTGSYRRLPAAPDGNHFQMKHRKPEIAKELFAVCVQEGKNNHAAADKLFKKLKTMVVASP